MAAQEEVVGETPAVEEKIEDANDDNNDDNVNENDSSAAEPLKEPAAVPKGKPGDENEEKVPFLCWRVTKRKRKKIILTLILYFGFFALVSKVCTTTMYIFFDICIRSQKDNL